jgi:hypothetical protein
MRSNLLHKTGMQKKDHSEILKIFKKRTKGIWYSFLGCCVYAIAFFPVNDLLFQFPEEEAFLYFAIGGVVVSLIQSAFYQHYIRTYKDSLTQTFLAKYLPGFSYLPNAGTKIQDYKDSLFYPEKEKEYQTFDFINHKHQGYKYYLSQVRSFRGDKSRIFAGLFASIELKIKIPAHTIILPEIYQATMGKVIATSFPGNGQFKGRVTKFDDSFFEKSYAVYSDDQPTSKVFINTKLMHFLTQHKKSNKREFFLSFKKNHLYIAIPFQTEMFHPTVLGLNKSAIKTLNELSDCFQIIHEMIEFIYLEDSKLKVA